MKHIMLPLMILFFNLGCKNAEEDKPKVILPAKELKNVSYGTDSQQKLDIYLPAGRDENTKVFILVHGGGWSGGSKTDFNYVVPILKAQFPNHAVVNIDYRLATMQSPAFPKQIQDIEKVIQHIKESDYSLSDDFAFIGASAGAHLSMLYSYKYDKAGDVKAVCNIVGPADFTDPYYAHHPYYHFAGMYLIGDMKKHPEAAIEVSPALQVTKDAPPTIMFYGGKDPVVPATQAERLKQKLDATDVPNEYHLYANGGHGGWNDITMKDFQDKLVRFIKKYF